MKVVGLTGQIATGKSLVAKMILAKGIPVIDLDQISREVVRKGGPAYRTIVKEFGRDILLPSGEVDRKKLGAIIFQDPLARRRLNAATHKWITLKAFERVVRLLLKGKPMVVIDAPLLLESNLQKLMSSIVVVYADTATQIQRIVQRDGLTQEEASLRISAQMSIEQKCKLADHVIHNTGTIEATEEQVNRIFDKLLAESRTTRHWLAVGISWLILLLLVALLGYLLFLASRRLVVGKRRLLPPLS